MINILITIESKKYTMEYEFFIYQDAINLYYDFRKTYL